MIPTTDEILAEDIVTDESEPSKIYKMNIEKNNISGFVDGIESVKQSIFKILNTERYEWLAYSWDYGVYTVDLFGKSASYVESELIRRITEALVQDDRISAVEGFSFEEIGNEIKSTFTVKTIFGDVLGEKVVMI